MLVHTASAQQDRFWLFFIDDLHLDFKATGHLRTLLDEIADGLTVDGGLFGIVTTGPSSITRDFSPDPKLMTREFKKVTGSGLASADIARIESSHEMTYRAAISIAKAREAVATLASASNGPKAIVYVSNGYDTGGLPVTGVGKPQGRPGLNTTTDDVRESFAGLVNDAQRAKVRIFVVDARRASAKLAVDPNVDPRAWQRYRAATSSSLQLLADRTGGVAVTEEESIASGLQRIRNANRD
jgi:hypothetical protein